MQTIPTPQSKLQTLKEIIQFVIITLIIVLPIRFFIAQPFIVSGGSMNSTFDDGNYLIVDEISYRFNNPNRGDVVIFKHPYDNSRYLIKRLIGLPGETVEMKAGIVTVKNKNNPNGFSLNETYLDSKNNLLYGSSTIDLESDEYYALGDNRIASSDSRMWGPLKKDLIVGRPFVRLWPLTRFSILPGFFDAYEKK
ncbi:MAG: signal peptidase I [Candidatus Taylorbacteria bacterium]|nr:signal peptidase I [Candidatus Taylorbacteria bacterium]